VQQRRLYRQLADPSRTGVEKLLGELESDVMEIAWRHGRVAVRRVMELLNADRQQSVAYTTVLTVMQRLAEKGLLSRTLIGKTHHYQARWSRDEFLSQSSHRIVRALVEDFGDVAIVQFLAALDHLDPERLRRLRARAGGADVPDDVP
jgi:predicted transcriptional regulator